MCSLSTQVEERRLKLQQAEQKRQEVDRELAKKESGGGELALRPAQMPELTDTFRGITRLASTVPMVAIIESVLAK